MNLPMPISPAPFVNAVGCGYRLAEVDKLDIEVIVNNYFYVNQNYVCSGAMVSVHLVSAIVRHQVDPSLAMLQQHITSGLPCRRHSLITGIGLPYAWNKNKESTIAKSRFPRRQLDDALAFPANEGD